MKKHLYEIKKLNIPAYLKWWFIKKKFAGVLSEVLENLTSPITLQDSLRRKFKIFQIGGNSVQDGEPSSTNEVPIQNVTGDVEVKVENKNKFDKNKAKLNSILNASGTEIASEGSFISDYILLKAGVNYYNNTRGYSNAGFYKLDKTFIERKSFNQNTVVTVEEDYYVRLNGTMANLETYQLEQSSTATTYEPHEEQTVTFPLSEGQVLHKGDTIEDKIMQRRGTVVLNGTERIEKEISSSAELGFYFKLYLPTKAKYINATSVPDTMLSTHFKIVENNILRYKSGCMSLSSTGMFVAFGITSTEDTVEKVQSWLAENLPILEYELETPIETEFTEVQRTAKAQIDKLISYKGTTYISSNNDPSPTFTIQYVKEE